MTPFLFIHRQKYITDIFPIILMYSKNIAILNNGLNQRKNVINYILWIITWITNQ